MTLTRTHSRPFSFSLRTVFVVVTLCCVWLGYQLSWMRQRHAEVERQWYEYAEASPPPAPLPLRILGEPGHRFLVTRYVEGSAELARVKSLFPEAIEVQAGLLSDAAGLAPDHTSPTR